MKRNSDAVVAEERERKDIVKRKNTERTERKRRRGMVEKKRRDRMNCSYMELMQLVPTVQRKKDTTKVEKAELLELTVEYIRNFHLSSKRDDSTVAEPGQFHKAGFQDCSTKFIQYVNGGVQGLGKNGESLQRNLLVFVEENLANTLGNNNLEETKDSIFVSTSILNGNKALSSALTFKTSLPSNCYPPTQVSSTNNNITQLIIQPLLHNHILLHNGGTVFVNPDNISVLTNPNPTFITHTSTDLARPDNINR